MQIQTIVGIFCNASLVTLFFPSAKLRGKASRRVPTQGGRPADQVAGMAPRQACLDERLVRELIWPEALIHSAERQLDRDVRLLAMLLRWWGV